MYYYSYTLWGSSKVWCFLEESFSQLFPRQHIWEMTFTYLTPVVHDADKISFLVSPCKSLQAYFSPKLLFLSRKHIHIQSMRPNLIKSLSTNSFNKEWTHLQAFINSRFTQSSWCSVHWIGVRKQKQKSTKYFNKLWK